MRAACKHAANILAEVEKVIVPGSTTDQIDEFVHWATINAGAYPSPLGYGGFLKSCCTSVNECIVHGVPDDRVLQEGDMVTVDVTCYYQVHHGDTARTFVVGGKVSLVLGLDGLAEWQGKVAGCERGGSDCALLHRLRIDQMGGFGPYGRNRVAAWMGRTCRWCAPACVLLFLFPGQAKVATFGCRELPR